MSIVLDLPPEIEKKIKILAQESGAASIAEYLSSVISETVIEKQIKPKPMLSFAELVAPLHRDFEASGKTTEEIEDLITREVKTHRKENQRGA